MPDQDRPRIPAYPRPVPYVCPDEAPVCPDTIVYEQWTDEAEEEARKRASKRRRIVQEAAESYLREEPVFILSAGLKGPFDEGWRNPWAKKRQRRDAEIPETTAKEALRRKSVMAAAVEANKNIAADRMPSNQQPTSHPKDEPSNVLNARSHNAQSEDRAVPLSARKVEDWLRRTEDEPQSRHIQVRSSPTPIVRPKHEQQAGGGHTNPFVTGDEDDRPPTSVVRAEDSMEAHIAQALTSSSQSTEASHESQGRAELAILEQKRQSIHKIPSSTHLPEFEYRRPGSRRQRTRNDRREESAPAAMPGAGIVQNKEHPKKAAEPVEVPRQPEAATSEEVPRSKPGLSKETSKASTVQENLPSAQVVAAPKLAAAPSNAHSTEQMLHSVPPVSSKEAVTESRPTEKQEIVPEIGKENQSGSRVNAGPAMEAEEAPAASLNKTPVRELETQEMIAAIQPFDFSTIKRPLKPEAERATPVTATKATKDKEKKKASFAISSPSSDGSQKSIKASMRVTKVTSKSVLGKSSPKQTAFGSLGSHVETFGGEGGKGFLDDSLPSVSAMFGVRKLEAPRGILKSSVVASTAPIPTATNTTSTSAKQDAQQVAEPPASINGVANAVDDEDDFDLDGAMDELGSYLGTWDPDVEASKLAV